jgi:FMN phosphatase YigB (HAD superfamily)
MGTVRGGMSTGDVPPDVIGDVRARLERGELDLLTCDVFDTLVWRPVAEPHHLFLPVGAGLAAEGLLPAHVSPADFRRARREAERRARDRNRRARTTTECTLEEIWALLPARWCAGSAAGLGIDEWRARGLAIELRTEADHLGVHAPVAELLTLAHRLGVTTALVSDTYFSAEQLRGLLAAAGAPLDAVDLVVVSCERAVSKHDGLLREVLRQAGADRRRALHLGDNQVADVKAAEAAGMIAVRSVVPDDERAAPAVLDAIAEYSADRGDDRGITATLAAASIEPAVRGRPDAELGAAVGGPLLRGFTHWASRTAAELGVDTIHCLLREGGTIAELLRLTEPDGPRPVTVHASRWTMLRAAVFDGGPDELYPALVRNADFEPSHVVEAFGVDPDLVADVLGDRPFSPPRRELAMARIAADDRLRAAIVDASTGLRRRVLAYLDGVLTPTAGRLVLCDIGWGGTIQEGIEKILRHERRLGDEDELIGLYLSVSVPGERRIGSGLRMRSYLPIDELHAREQAVLQRTPEILEQLCTPDEGTLLDFADDGRPLTAAGDPTWTPSRAAAQEAMRAMVVRLAEVDAALAGRTGRPEKSGPEDGPGDGTVWCDPRFRSALLRGIATTLDAPTPALARTLSGWLHDDVAGGRVVPLADPAALDYFRYLNAADLDAVSMQEVFWLAGAAASTNPTLAAQLAAAAKGVDADALCPPSTAGRATVAVFEPGSQVAVAVDDPLPRTGAHGWSLLRLQTDTTAVRDVRIDFGESDHLVELARLRLRFHLADEAAAGADAATTVWDLDGFDDPRLRWVGGGRTLSAHLAAVRAGGHAIVAVTGRGEAGAHRVEVECAFRASALAPADARRLLPSASRVRAEALAHRAGSAAARRGRSLVDRRRAQPAPTAPATPATTGPTFSIVLPIYESPHDHLADQLQAIRSQTHRGWECIVVDDGSADPAPRELAQRVAAADDRFTLHVRPSNGGIAAATNDALDRAANEWIVFVDHDDLIHADALATIAAHIRAHPDDDVVYTDERTVDEHGDQIVEYRKPDYSPERLLRQNYFCHIVSIRRTLVERIGRLDAAFEPSADREFNLRAAEAARAVGHVPQVLYSWRAIPGSVATALDEKSAVAPSVVAAAEQSLARRGQVATVETTPGDGSTVAILLPSPVASVEQLPLAPATTPAEIHDALCRSAADVVVLVPTGAPPLDPAGLDQLVALSVRPQSPVVGPRVVSDDGRLVSAGRVNHPAFGDLYQGIDAANPGPWGAFAIAREVSSISPLGAVLHRRAVGELGGFDLDAIVRALLPDLAGRVDLGTAAASVDLTMAALGTALHRSGRPALWSPQLTIEVPAAAILDGHARDDLAEQHRRLAALCPPLADEPFSPTGVFHP